MFMRRLVTGVRSSCEASATSWRCACTEASSALIESSQRVEHRVEAARQAPDLVLAARLDASVKVLRRATCSAVCVRRLTAATAAPATSRPSSAASAMPPSAEQREDQAQVVEQVVDFGQRLGELDRAARCRALGEDAQLDAVDARVAEEGLAARARQRARARVDRERDRGAERNRTLPWASISCW